MERADAHVGNDGGVWHQSRYNIVAPIPGKETYAVANLFRGTCGEYSLAELYLLSVVEKLGANHPILPRFERAGLACTFDELAALETMARGLCARGDVVQLVVCPTLACNFDCPYCFEHHGAGRMSAEVQDDVVALAERMLEVSGATALDVTWFGGEPLLAPQVIDSLGKRLIALCEAQGVRYHSSIFTNAYLLTQEIVDMLALRKVSHAQITLDGLGAMHDRTRPLAGGGPTFQRIVDNLRSVHIPFKVFIRQNVNAQNAASVSELQAFVNELARESGNDIAYHPVTMVGSAASERASRAPRALEGDEASRVGLLELIRSFRHARPLHCDAQTLWSVCVDEQGRLIKCWEGAARSDLSFGTAHDWDPADPLATADDPDKLTMYLNTANPALDEECRSCVWLPVCAGGCPQKLLFGKRECVPYKDDAQACAIALYEQLCG